MQNVSAVNYAEAARKYLTRVCADDKIIAKRTDGIGDGPGHYGAYELKHGQYVPVRRVESVIVQLDTRDTL